MSAQPTTHGAAPDLVNVEIDGKPLRVPKNSMIIQAADAAGIAIPRFCYHKKLPIAANCRECMVETEINGKVVPKPQPACATPVMEGMKVFTQSARALAGQRNALEFLLINHPLDCPICDQGGECELQDLTLGFGRSVSRFTERKRVVPDEDIGPLVSTEMTRCIHCTRCVRVLSDIAGTHEFGDMDLSPYANINPCGYAGLQVTQTRDLGVRANADALADALAGHLLAQLGYTDRPINHGSHGDFSSRAAMPRIQVSHG